MPNLAIGEANFPVGEFAASDYGRAWLERRPEVVDALAKFSIGGERPEEVFNPGPDSLWQFVHTSGLTETRAYGVSHVAAVETSTYTTGRDRWRQGYPTKDRFRAPAFGQLGTRAFRTSDGVQSLLSAVPSVWQRRPPRVDLVDQSAYLDALGDEIGTDPTEELFVPRQWFALRSPSGDTLTASQHVPGWVTVSDWLRAHGTPGRNALGITFDHDQVVAQCADRVRTAVGYSALRHGLDEMLLSGEGRYYGDTMIVPENITSPRDSQLGIVRISPARQDRTYRRAMGAAANLLAERAADVAAPEPQPAHQG